MNSGWVKITVRKGDVYVWLPNNDCLVTIRAILRVHTIILTLLNPRLTPLRPSSITEMSLQYLVLGSYFSMRGDRAARSGSKAIHCKADLTCSGLHMFILKPRLRS